MGRASRTGLYGPRTGTFTRGDVPLTGIIRIIRPGDPRSDMQWVGFGGKLAEYVGPMAELGVAIPRGTPSHGLRTVLFDLAYGYVNGFPKRDIAYFVLTRSLSRRLCNMVLAWENRRAWAAHHKI